MPSKPKQRIIELDRNVDLALADLKSGKFTSQRQAAKAYGISPSTFNARANGGSSTAEAHQSRQLLTPAQENAIESMVKRMHAFGHPLRYDAIRELAQELLHPTSENSTQNEVNVVAVGTSWAQRFLHRHKDLVTVYCKTIENGRIEVQRRKVIQWFATVKELIDENHISDDNIYNLDETGTAIGTIEASYAVIDKNTMSRYQGHPGRQEWVTVLECVCGDGSAIPPLIIFKGRTLSSSWIPVNDIKGDWHFSRSENGWTSNDIAFEWLRKVFDPATKEKANGQPRLLIVDGHESHIQARFAAYCMQNNIELVLLLPHSSHLLQPLDVGVFGPLKKELSKVFSKLLSLGIRCVEKYEWVMMYAQARPKALSAANIKGGWRGSGIILWNIGRVLHALPEDSESPEVNVNPIQVEESTGISFTHYASANSPMKSQALHSIHAELDKKLASASLESPIKSQISKLTHDHERLLAENILLKHQLKASNDVLQARTERKNGKRITVKDRVVISVAEVVEDLIACEEAAKRKEKEPKKRGQKGRIAAATQVEGDKVEPIEVE